MRFEDSSGPLRDFVIWLVGRVKELAGADFAYQEGSGWYRSPPPDEKVRMYIQIVGKKATKNYKNSVLLSMPWSKECDNYPWLVVGNAFFGKDSADFNARPEIPEDKMRVDSFIRLAFSLPDNTPEYELTDPVGGHSDFDFTEPPTVPTEPPTAPTEPPTAPTTSPKPKWLSRLVKVAIRAIIVAILTGIGSQIGGWAGGLVTAILSSLAALLIGEIGAEHGDGGY